MTEEITNYNLKEKSYICPACKEKQESINQWQTCSVCYEYTFANEGWEQQDIENGDFESWNCPSCGVELSADDEFIKLIV